MVRCPILVVLLQVSIDILLPLGRVGASRTAKFLVPAVHLFVSVEVTPVFSGIVARVTTMAALF